jgi:hypothetical protein
MIIVADHLSKLLTSRNSQVIGFATMFLIPPALLIIWALPRSRLQQQVAPLHEPIDPLCLLGQVAPLSGDVLVGSADMSSLILFAARSHHLRDADRPLLDLPSVRYQLIVGGASPR